MISPTVRSLKPFSKLCGTEIRGSEGRRAAASATCCAGRFRNQSTSFAKHTITRWEPPVSSLLMHRVFIMCTLYYSGFLIKTLCGTNSNAVTDIHYNNTITFINRAHNLIKRRRQFALTGSITSTPYLIGIIYITLPQFINWVPYQLSRYFSWPRGRCGSPVPCHLSFAPCHLFFAPCHLSFALCHLSFAPWQSRGSAGGPESPVAKPFKIFWFIWRFWLLKARLSSIFLMCVLS